MTTTPPTTTGTTAGEMLSDEQLNDLLEFDVGSPRVTSLLSGHITALTTQLAASREREARLRDQLAERDAELAAALRRIDDAVIRLDALEDRARNVLAAHSTTIDAEYVAVTAGQIEDSLSDWLTTVGNEVLSRSALTETEEPR